MVYLSAYRDDELVLTHLGLSHALRPRRLALLTPVDNLLCLFPFAWAWCDIAIVVTVSHKLDHGLTYAAGALLIAGRLRALHEFSHMAIHGSLAPSKRWQYFTADMLFHFPACRFDSRHRYIHHCIQHHPHPNDLNRDPNIRRFIDAGVVPGISRSRFYLKLLHPLTPRGLYQTLHSISEEIRQNETARAAVLRACVCLAVIGVLRHVGGLKQVIWSYAIPVAMLYPLLSWIALLAEHRWFAATTGTGRQRELECGRPTDYSGISGWCVKSLISPAADHFHLAHSLYPHVPWVYLRTVDARLKRLDAAYCRYISSGLLLTRNNRPSALSELRHRLTEPGDMSVAQWAATLAAEE